MISSFCDSGACVNVEEADGGVRVWMTEVPGLYLWYSKDEWKAFVLGAKAGEFDFDLFSEETCSK